MASKLQILMRHKGLLHEIPKAKQAELEGEVLSLFLASNRHRHSTIDDFASVVLPAIHFNQFRIYRDADRPIGWVSWAYMSDEDASGYIAGDFDFKISTWKSGKHFWFIDFIAPFGHALKIADDLKKNVFPTGVGFAPDIDEKTGEKRVRKFFGTDVKGVDRAESHAEFLKKIT